jgi:hypothetical protein
MTKTFGSACTSYFVLCSCTQSCKFVRDPPIVSINAEVTSGWKGSSKSDSSSLHSMMFEDNVGEDGLSAQSSCTIDINYSNYIDNLAPHPTMFDNEVSMGEDTLKKVYTQLIKALNDVRIQKSTNSTLSAVWNGKSQNTYIGQVRASGGVVKSDDNEFLIGVFITLVPISGCVMILGNVQCSKLQLKEQ